VVTAANNLPRTVGELRAAGHRERGVKQEIRENLLARLTEGADGEAIWPGILGFEDTVLPQLERALIAGHDFVLLGAVRARPDCCGHWSACSTSGRR
jgi:magnesium chelatase subunit I